jgi:hypothetical protein
VITYRRLRWTSYVTRMEEGRSAFKILTGKPIGKRPLERSMYRWEDNIRIELVILFYFRISLSIFFLL